MKDVCSVGYSKAFASCDMETDGGGWLVIQRRFNGTVPFNRTLEEYENGFGDPSGEFWYGLKNILCFTQNEATELRIDLEYPNGTTGYVHYKRFSMSNSRPYYTASVSTFKSSPGVPNRFYKSTPYFYINSNCRGSRVGGWWDNNCRGNPNGPGAGQNSNVHAMWNGAVVTKTEIKIRHTTCIVNPAFQCQYYQEYY